MNIKHSIKTSIIGGVALITAMILMFPSISASITIDADDGFWFDDFQYTSNETAEENLDIDNCEIDIDDGEITLLPETEPRSYNFAEEDNSHKASVYRSWHFSPIWPLTKPDRHLAFGFNIRDIDGIKEDDDLFATRSSNFLYSNVIQEFRFQFDIGADSIGTIEIELKGESYNTEEVVLYYWTNGEYSLQPSWKELDSSTSGQIDFDITIDAENASLAVMDDNYFYVCVVATSINVFTTCTLSSNFIQITSFEEETWDTGPGTITTKTAISPNLENFYWEMLTWNDYKPDQTNIRYQILYDPEDNGEFIPIPDELEYFSGSNKNGFSSSPVFLNKIPTSGSKAIKKLRIRANFTSDTASKTPKLYSWAVTWQKNHSLWQDSFNSSYRIDAKSKINIVDGLINISSLQGEWPMFGYNTENTRATDGRGPQSSNPPLKWYSSNKQLVGGGFRNPVIGDDGVYLFNTTDGLMKFDIQGSKPNSPIEIPVPFETNCIYMNSPIITEEYIIVASGQTGSGGKNNRIQGLSKDFESSWKFDYNEPICYYSSPVVYENKLVICSWSGDTDLLFPEVTNNKVIALDLDATESGGFYDNDDEVMLWEYDLPAGSYSTPAIYNGMVFVGCSESSGDSFFVLDAEGNGDGTTDLIWSEPVGAIGKSSPVIHNNIAFLTSKSLGKIQITALDINGNSTDRVLWKKSICILPDGADADSTPAVYNGILYVASPRGTVYALNATDGETLWSKSVYITFLRNYLTSSPVYADEHLYIGTPSGKIFALDTNDNGSIVWEQETFESETFANAPVFSSPIVSNGMLFIADEFGVLYAFGTYEELDKEMKGSVTSIPINLPTGFWWSKFYANYTTETGSTIKFSILDSDRNHINNISNGDIINLGNRPNLRTLYLHAYLTAANISVNPNLGWWKITFESDNNPPEFIMDSFFPNKNGWLTENVISEFIVNVKDKGTGLDVNTAQFTLGYTTNDGSYTKQYDANCTGQNGTTSLETITADIYTLEFYEDIIKIDSIEISIFDLAGNENSTGKIILKKDTEKPESSVDNETEGKEFNSDIVKINITAKDPGTPDVNSSGVASVSLFYRHSTDDTTWSSWTEFEEPMTSSPYSWNFTDVKHGGYYELYSVATDNADNIEDEPANGDVSFILDNEPPDIPDGLSGQHWYNSSSSISIEFSDDFLLDTIKYKPNLATEYTIIASNINKATYDSAWEIESEYWNEMENGKQYQLYFWISDSVGNIRTIEEDGYVIIKDEAKPTIILEIPNLTTKWISTDTFIISAFATDGNGSGIKSVELFYRYSEDGNFNGTWTSYGVLTSEPFEWEFEADEGNGYYEFKIVAEDVAGNVAESEVFSTGINIFPVYSVVAMVILIIALILITFVIFIKWRKK